MLAYITSAARALSAPRSGLSIIVRGLKTNKSAAKRIRPTGNGDFKRKYGGRNHGNIGWSRSKVLRGLNGNVRSRNAAQHKRFREYLPYA